MFILRLLPSLVLDFSGHVLLGPSGQRTLQTRESPQAKTWALGTGGPAGCRQNGQGTDVDRAKQHLLQQPLKGTQKQPRRSRQRREENPEEQSPRVPTCRHTRCSLFAVRIPLLAHLRFILPAWPGAAPKSPSRLSLSHLHRGQPQPGVVRSRDASRQGERGKRRAHSWLATDRGWKPSLENIERRNLY